MPRHPFVLGTAPWDPSHRFETSWLVSPTVLGLVRALLALYIFAQHVAILAWNCVHADADADADADPDPDPDPGGGSAARSTFAYFTVLTNWGLGFYFAAAAVHTLTYARSRTGTPLLDRFPRALQALHAFFYTTVTVFPLIVSAVYWCVLYEGPWYATVFEAWHNVSQHVLNAVFALLEIALARTAPPPWVHMAWVLVVLALYLGLAYAVRATAGFYVYAFLDPGALGSPGLVAAYVVGIALAGIVFFSVVRGLIGARLWATETKLGMAGKLAHADRPAVGDVDLGHPGKAVGLARRL